MPTYHLKLPDGEPVSVVACQDPHTSQAYTLKLPHTTEDPSEISALLDVGAVEIGESKSIARFKGGDSE